MSRARRRFRRLRTAILIRRGPVRVLYGRLTLTGLSLLYYGSSSQQLRGIMDVRAGIASSAA